MVPATPQPKRDEPLIPDNSDLEGDSLQMENDYQTKARQLSSSLNQLLGIVILVLSVIVLILVIISFFIHLGQPDKTLLLIEQLIGFALFILASVTGTLLIIQARRTLHGEPAYVLEPINDVSDDLGNGETDY